MEAANLASRHLSASPLLLCEAFADCHVVCLGSKVRWPRMIPECVVTAWTNHECGSMNWLVLHRST